MIIFLVVLILLLYLAQNYFLAHSLDEVHYFVDTSKVTVDPDEEFDVITTLQNKKRFMPVLLRVREILPYEIKIAGDGYEVLKSATHTTHLTYKLYLKRKGKVTRYFRASLPDRGRYFFRGATLYGNDFIGIRENNKTYDLISEVVVVPRRAERSDIGEVVGGFLGEVSANRFILEDPMLTVGFREYTGREPMKSISWSQSARGRGLMVKNYDYTTEPTVTVILAISPENEREIEECFSLARTVCEELENKKVRYDFLTNSTAAGAIGIWNSVTEGTGKHHLYTILEGLGRATYATTRSISQTLDKAYRRSAKATSYILITPVEDEFVRKYVARFTSVKGGAFLVVTPREVKE